MMIDMVIEKTLVQKIVSILEEIKAIDTMMLEIHQQTSIADMMIICTGRSDRHVKAIGKKLIAMGKAIMPQTPKYEGMNAGEWVLVDFGDIIVHVMQKEIRSFYQLEALWNQNLHCPIHNMNP